MTKHTLPLTKFQKIMLFSCTTSGDCSAPMPSFSNIFSSSFLKTKGLRYGTVIKSLSSGARETEKTGVTKAKCASIPKNFTAVKGPWGFRWCLSNFS